MIICSGNLYFSCDNDVTLFIHYWQPSPPLEKGKQSTSADTNLPLYYIFGWVGGGGGVLVMKKEVAIANLLVIAAVLQWQVDTSEACHCSTLDSMFQ